MGASGGLRAFAGDPGRSASPPIEASKAAVCYVRNTSIRDVASSVSNAQVRGSPVGGALSPPVFPATGKLLGGEFYAEVGIATMFTRSKFQA